MNRGFPKQSRLLCPKDYSPVFNKPSFRVSNSGFLLLARSSNLKQARLGVIVSKKNIPKANQRNRIKRLIRESFRIKNSTFATIDLVVLAKKGLDSLENNEINAHLDHLFNDVSSKQQFNKSGHQERT